MATLEIIGAPQSNFVRTVRMACIEKDVAYTLDPARPHTPPVDAIHPLGKILVMRHGDVTLCELKAICTYIDLAFDGPPLIPRDPRGAAMTEQWISLVNTAIAPAFQQYLMAYFFSGLPDGAPDRTRIEAILPKVGELLGLLEMELTRRAWLAGPAFTLADAYLLPLIHYLRKLPETGEMLREKPALDGWYGRVAARPSAIETEPPPIGSRA